MAASKARRWGRGVGGGEVTKRCEGERRVLFKIGPLKMKGGEVLRISEGGGRAGLKVYFWPWEHLCDQV